MAPPLQPFPSGFPVTPRFEYVATLGRGGMGCVYEAFDRERGVAVALKTLLEVSPQRVLHLKREFRTLRDVRHPHLIALDDLVEVDGTWFFTMELLRGVDLFTYVRGRRADPPPAEETGSTSAMTATRWGAFDGVEPDPFVRPPPPDERPAPRFDEPRLRRVLGHLALGLDALHAAGLVHRDVKPANVLVAGDRAVLLDFGIAGRLEDEPHDGSVAGTWPYAAP
ncbi:MAG: serine/threonine protein kinase, partial [Deltaproteobacteria bacterium]|nr:serine/threonine protein kinase [Kofleriaceae bacterium]